jgi:2-polyprenyl-3-methyl-5-hydroxy-6-metoxy-1,4-benzoquinol methylase
VAEDYKRFAKLGFEDFRAMACDDSLSPNEKIGFPDSYREGKEEAILDDLIDKLPALALSGMTVVDIGPGCGALAKRMIRHCTLRSHRLVLVDSAEMLSHLDDESGVEKVPARFPACEPMLQRYAGRADAIVVYSVIHHVFLDGNLWAFFDQALSLLAPGGRMLIGDIPNVSKRSRFFASAAGARIHREFTGTDDAPPVTCNQLAPDHIDDSVVIALLMRARGQGFDAYVMPQPPALPMATRREDILVIRP